MGAGQHLDNGSGNSKHEVEAARIARRVKRPAKPMPNPVRFDPSAPPIDPMLLHSAPSVRDVNRGVGLNWKGYLAVVLVWESIAIFVLILPHVFSATPGWPVAIGVIMIFVAPVATSILGLLFLLMRLRLNARMVRRGEIPVSNSRVVQLPPTVQVVAVAVGAAVGLHAAHEGSTRRTR